MTQSYGNARPRRSICGVCGEPTSKPTRMCQDCSTSYDAHARQDGSVLEVISWAARRSRWYEQRRKRPGTVMLTLAELEHLRDFAHNVDDPDDDDWWAGLDKKLTAALRAARANAKGKK